MTDIRVTRQGLEVLTPIVSSPVTRVTRQGLEVLTPVVSSPVAQVTRIAMEVLYVLPVVGGDPGRRTVITVNFT